VQETLNVVTRKQAIPITFPDAGRFLDEILAPLWVGLPSTALYHLGIELQAHYRLAFSDALIVAAAIEAGCTRLLSEDLQHGQRIQDVRIENPFRA